MSRLEWDLGPGAAFYAADCPPDRTGADGYLADAPNSAEPARSAASTQPARQRRLPASARLQFNVLRLHKRDAIPIVENEVLEQRRVLIFRAVPIVPSAVLIPPIEERH